LNIDAAITLIKHFEGCHLEAYHFPGEKWLTIGYGVTQYPDGRAVRAGDRLTQQEADELLIATVKRKQREIEATAPAVKNFNERVYNAVLSFWYNAKTSVLEPSTTLKHLKAGDAAQSLLWISKWCNGDIGPLLGLQRRRMCEFKYACVGEIDYYLLPGGAVDEARLRREYEIREQLLKKLKSSVTVSNFSTGSAELSDSQSKQLVSSTTVALLETRQPTIFKSRPIQHIKLPEDEKVKLGRGMRFPVRAYKEESNHYKCTFDGGTTLVNGRNTLFAYAPHVKLIPVRDSPQALATGMTAIAPAVPKSTDSLPQKAIAWMRQQGMLVLPQNIIYFRNTEPDTFKPLPPRVNRWNCSRCIVTDEGKIVLCHWATTLPGLKWMKRLMNKKGTFILRDRVQFKAWEIGTHRRPGHTALIQTKGPVEGWRDANLDAKHDYIGTFDKGWFGINQHHGYGSSNIGGNSAGCQVGKNVSSHEKFMSVCKQDRNLRENNFPTIVLVGEWLWKQTA